MNVGGQGSLEAAMRRRTGFYAEAIAAAKANGYDGFSSDEELRGGASGSASLHDSTFSRTVWRLYGGAKGLVM